MSNFGRPLGESLELLQVSETRPEENSTQTTEMVDSFIRRIQTRELEYDSEKATSIIYEHEEFGKKQKKSFIDALAWALADYQQHKDLNRREALTKAWYAFLWINRAFLHGIVKEGPGLFKRMEEYKSENELLRTQLEALSEEKELFNKMSDTAPGKGFKGES